MTYCSTVKISFLRTCIHNVRIEHEKSSKEYESFQVKIAEDRFIRRTQQQNVQDSRMKLLEIRKEKEGLDNRIETFASQEKEIRQRIKKYNSEISRINRENKKLQSSLFEGKEKVLELSNDLELSSREKMNWSKPIIKHTINCRDCSQEFENVKNKKTNFLIPFVSMKLLLQRLIMKSNIIVVE